MRRASKLRLARVLLAALALVLAACDDNATPTMPDAGTTADGKPSHADGGCDPTTNPVCAARSDAGMQ